MLSIHLPFPCHGLVLFWDPHLQTYVCVAHPCVTRRNRLVLPKISTERANNMEVCV